MSIEYISSSSDVLPNYLLFSNLSYSSLYELCQLSVASNVIFTVYSCINVFLLLLLFIFILYMGFQRRNRQSSTPTGATMSHSDFFTYQLMFVEISGVLGSASYTLGNYTKTEAVLMLGVFLSSITLPGQTLFHLLTCMERHLAVVHPITYMRLSQSFGVRIRNISSVCVWLLCFGWIGALAVFSNNFPVVPFFSVFAFCVLLILYFSASVLFVLIRPGPGEVGCKKERVDQSKRRAFKMLIGITGTLLLRCVGLLFWFGLENMTSLGLTVCVLMDSGIWLTVPSSLVLPLLYLHRTGKLSCFRQTIKSR